MLYEHFIKLATQPSIDVSVAKDILTRAGFELARWSGDHYVWLPTQKLIEQLKSEGKKPVFDVGAKRTGPLMALISMGSSKNTVELYRNIKDILKTLNREDLLLELNTAISRPTPKKNIGKPNNVWIPKWFGPIIDRLKKAVDEDNPRLIELFASYYQSALSSDSGLSRLDYNSKIVNVANLLKGKSNIKISLISANDLEICLSILGIDNYPDSISDENIKNILNLLDLESNDENIDNIIYLLMSKFNFSKVSKFKVGETKLLKIAKYLYKNNLIHEAKSVFLLLKH